MLQVGAVWCIFSTVRHYVGIYQREDKLEKPPNHVCFAAASLWLPLGTTCPSGCTAACSSASSWRSAHLAEMLYNRFLPPFSGRAASTGSPELAAFQVALALHLPSQRCRLGSFLPWLPPSPIRWLLSRRFSPPSASYPALLHLLPACSSALNTPMNTTSLLATSAGTQQTLCTKRAGLP